MKKTIAAITAIVFCVTLAFPPCARGSDKDRPPEIDAAELAVPAVAIGMVLSFFLFRPKSVTKEPIEEKKPSNEDPAKTGTSITSGIDVSESNGKPVVL